MQKVLKQNLRKIVIYENKRRPAASDRSQSTTSEGCKNFNNYQYYNQHDMSTSAPTAMHETCINVRTEHQPIIWHNNLRIEEVYNRGGKIVYINLRLLFVYQKCLFN